MSLQTYAKGDSIKTATSPAEKVALEFEGYKPVAETVAENVDYRDLQAQARQLGIPANQRKDALAAYVAKSAGSTTVETPVSDDDQ